LENLYKLFVKLIRIYKKMTNSQNKIKLTNGQNFQKVDYWSKFVYYRGILIAWKYGKCIENENSYFFVLNFDFLSIIK